MIDFPSSPSVGQIFNSGTGPVYIWDGVAWSLTGITSNLLPAMHDWIKDLITVRTSTVRVTVGVGSMKAGNLFVTNGANIAKDINATWAAGNAVGGMESGFSVAANTTYFLHALYNPTTGAFDWIYSPNLTVATVPAGYVYVGRFWIVYTNASSQITDYVQHGNNCYMTPVTWFSTSAGIAAGLASAPATQAIPGGIETYVAVAVDTAVNGNGLLNINVYDAPGSTFPAFSQGIRLFEGITGVAAANQGSAVGKVKSNKSRQLYMSAAVAGTSGAMTLQTSGWEDYQLNRIY